MSKINTGFINANYPAVGVVNTTQQFRDNWQTIKTNLDTANTEITELQAKVLVKAPLANATFNNDMSGTLISNALISGFRHTTKNLGNNISGTLTINVTDADVQYATVSGPVTLAFTGWPAASGNQTAVQSNCQLIFRFASTNANRQIFFPSTVQYGLTTLPNYSGNGVAGYVTFPTSENQVHYNFTTTNSGSAIEVQPLDLPRVATGAGTGTVTSVGATGTGFSVTGSPITSSGNMIIRNTGVTSLNAGSNIGLSASTGNVTVTNTTTVPRFSLSTPNPQGAPGDTPGRMVVSTQYVYVCTKAYDGVSSIWKRAQLT